MYCVTVEKTFAASHSLREYEGVCRNLHGHNFKVIVEISGENLDKRGMLVDFIDIDNELNEIIKNFDHKNLNNVIPFNKENPTAENLSKVIYYKLKDNFSTNNVKVSKVTVFETDEFSATYFE